MITQNYIRLFLFISLFLFCKFQLLSQEAIITIDNKGNIFKNDTFQLKIKLEKKSYVSIVDVNFESSIIEVFNFKSKKIISSSYFLGKSGTCKFLGKIVDFRKSNKKDIITIDTTADNSIKQIYYSRIILSDIDIVSSLYGHKALCLIANFIHELENDSLKILIEGHDELKRNLSVSSPRFYDNGTKMAYISGDEFSTKRYVVLYDLDKKLELLKIEINSEAIKLFISKTGESVLLYILNDNKKNLYDIYFQSLKNNEIRYIGCYKAARLN